MTIDSCGSKYEVSSWGNIRRKTRGKPLKLKVDKRNGYVLARLYEGGICKQSFAHRLVAIAFLPNPDNKPAINHINGIKTDNRVDNLEWVTHAENFNHARYVLGSIKYPVGENSHRALFDNEQVKSIRSLFLAGKKQREISEIYKCHASTISKIVMSKCYKSNN